MHEIPEQEWIVFPLPQPLYSVPWWKQTAEDRCGQRAEEPDKALWLRTYLFPYLLLLQLTFLQSCYFVVYLQSAFWAKFASNVLWVGKGLQRKARERWGEEFSKKYYVTDISVKAPSLVIRLLKTDGEVETEKPYEATWSSLGEGSLSTACKRVSPALG